MVRSDDNPDSNFDENAEYLCLNEQTAEDAKGWKFIFLKLFKFLENYFTKIFNSERDSKRTLFALLEFDKEVLVPNLENTIYMASRRDADVGKFIK